MEARLTPHRTTAKSVSHKILGRFSGTLPEGELWIFGYGSLMWNPGFEYVARHHARLYGYHRALCVHSTQHRGTPQDPGLVMGLAPGGSCHGIAFRIDRRSVAPTLLALWHREMRARAYHPRLVQVSIHSMPTPALAFVVDRTHPNFAGELGLAEIARRIVRCRGQRGANIDYLLNTVELLAQLGVKDRRLAKVHAAVRALCKP